MSRILSGASARPSGAVATLNLSASLALPKRAPPRSRAARRNVVTAFGGYGAAASLDSPSVVTLISQVASAAAWAAAVWLGYQLKLQQDSERQGQRECDTCGGSGLVECFCMRWSDGDKSGCGTCCGTRKMACSSCRGGGMAVPIEAKVYIKRESDYNSRNL